MPRVFASWASIALALVYVGCGSSEPLDPATGGSPGGAILGGGSSGGGNGGSSSATPISGASGSVTVAGSGGAPTSGGTSTSSGGGGASTTDGAASKTALEQLKAWLALDVAARPTLSEQGFSKAALTKPDSAEAQQLLVSDYTAQLKATRAAEMGASESVSKSISAGGVTMKYYRAERGKKPPTGWNLFISMHGGGNADAATNDSQWENQIALVDGYDPKDAI